MLRDEYDGVLPDTMEELLRLSGVGRKIANLLLGDIYGKLDEYRLQGVELPDKGAFIINEEALRQMMDAILADCAGGDLAQDWGYTDQYEEHYWLTMQFVSQDGLHYYTELRFTEASANLMAWYHIQKDILDSSKNVE